MKYIAGIDVGTTGAKCGIFSEDGVMVSSGYREYTCDYPNPGWVEQDVSLLTRMAFEATKDALVNAGIDVRDVCSVSLSSQRSCSIFLDSNEAPLKMISWQDNRTDEEVRYIAECMSHEEYYKITGLPLSTTWVITKMLWVRKNMPELWSKTKRVVQLHDYILRALGADDYYVDIPDALLSGLWDNDRSEWSDRIIDLFGIDRGLLPVAKICGTRVGSVSKEAAERTGLAEGTPICVGAGDQNSAAVGAGVIREGIASVSIGTGGMTIILIDEPYRDPDMKAAIGSHAIFGKWQFEGYQTGSAGVFRWFRDEIAALEKAQAQEQGADVYVKLNEMIREIPPGAEGLVFLPLLASSAAPRWNPDARGTLCGLTFAHGRRHIARAVMEGITLEQKDILKSMSVTGQKIDKVRIVGGAAKSEIWCQIQADMYGSKVETLRVPDAALVGAAIFAGLGVGLFPDIEEAVEKMVHAEKEYSPIAENVSVYNELYEIYCKAYDAFDEFGVFSAISGYQAKNATNE